MPSHLYSGTKTPPRMLDIMLAHALELSVATYSAIMGAFVTINATSYAGRGHGALAELPLFLVYAVGIFVCVGGITALVGLLIRRDNVRLEINIEQIGWIILSVGWLSYLYAALRHSEGTTSAIVAGLCIGIGGIVRVIALAMLERQLEIAVEGGDPSGEQEDTDA